jgi:hypothetical protein
MRIKKYKEHEYDAKLADKKIKFCNTCNRCWEIDKEATKTSYNRKLGRIIYSYYEDFPKYGKQTQECSQCKGE